MVRAFKLLHLLNSTRAPHLNAKIFKIYRR